MSRTRHRSARAWQSMRPAEPAPASAARFAALHPHGQLWRNDQYTAISEPAEHPPGWTHLSIRRNDRAPIHDWRDLQRIKDDVLGAHVEAVELYPAADRLLDTANQYHLWAGPPGQRFAFGFFAGRIVGSPAQAAAVGARQRPGAGR